MDDDHNNIISHDDVIQHHDGNRRPHQHHHRHRHRHRLRLRREYVITALLIMTICYGLYSDIIILEVELNNSNSNSNSSTMKKKKNKNPTTTRSTTTTSTIVVGKKVDNDDPVVVSTATTTATSYDNNNNKKKSNNNWIPFMETINTTTSTSSSIWNDFYINTVDDSKRKGRMLCHRKCSDSSRNSHHPNNNNNIQYYNKNPNNNNYIIYGTKNDYSAGLSDRLYILNQLTELASYLCASGDSDGGHGSSGITGGGVWFGTPTRTLSRYHNNNITIDNTLTWKDFRKTTQYQYQYQYQYNNHHEDQEENEEEIYINEYITDNPVIIRDGTITIRPRKRTRTQQQQQQQQQQQRNNLIKLDRNQYRLFHTKDPSQVINHFLQIQNMSFGYNNDDNDGKQQSSQSSQTNFVWYIDIYYYSIKEQLHGWIRNQTLLLQQQQQQISTTTTTTNPNPFNNNNNYYNNYYYQPLLLPLQGHPYCKYTESSTLTKTMSKLVTDFQKMYLLPQIQKQLVVNMNDDNNNNNNDNDDDDDHHRNNNKNNDGIDIHSLLIGSWHIRRKDSIAVCDTSLERMQRYYDCTFRRQSNAIQQILQKTKKRHLVVLLYSDETSIEYRQSIRQMFITNNNNTKDDNKDDDGLNINALWLDDLVTDFFTEQVNNGTIPLSYKNNYHMYGLLHELTRSTNNNIIASSSFHLEHRWQIVCPDCVNLTTHIRVVT